MTRTLRTWHRRKCCGVGKALERRAFKTTATRRAVHRHVGKEIVLRSARGIKVLALSAAVVTALGLAVLDDPIREANRKRLVTWS